MKKEILSKILHHPNATRREREMGDEIDIREDIAQLIRDVAAPRDAEIATLRAK